MYTYYLQGPPQYKLICPYLALRQVEREDVLCPSGMQIRARGKLLYIGYNNNNNNNNNNDTNNDNPLYIGCNTNDNNKKNNDIVNNNNNNNNNIGF